MKTKLRAVRAPKRGARVAALKIVANGGGARMRRKSQQEK